MNAYKSQHYVAAKWILGALAAGLVMVSGAAGVTEETFRVLQVGTQTYTNVTVTTRAKNYVFILHQSGMASIKPSELPPEAQEALGYAKGRIVKSSTNAVTTWAKWGIAKVGTQQVKALGKQLEQKWRGPSAAKLSVLGLAGSTLIFAVLGTALLIYLFHCYCCMLICQKTGHAPGVLVWLPVFQVFPLLRAADMSVWWFLGFCVPVLNIIGHVLWCFKIVKARAKNAWVAVLLLLPFTNLFAFLYLAFSNGASAHEDKNPEPRIMNLQTA
jgi:hypothetical protein